jgi:hypothetical protein
VGASGDVDELVVKEIARAEFVDILREKITL